MTQVQLIARHTIAAGNEDEAFALLDKLISAARTEPGNLAFDMYRKAGDARSYVLLERYASRDALAAHRDAPHFKEYLLGKIVPLLESRAVEEYDVPRVNIVSGCLTVTNAAGGPAPLGAIHAHLSGRVFQSLPVTLAEGHSLHAVDSSSAARRRIPMAAGEMDLGSLNGDITLRLTWDGDEPAETLVVVVELGTVSVRRSPTQQSTAQLRITSRGGPAHAATGRLPRRDLIDHGTALQGIDKIQQIGRIRRHMSGGGVASHHLWCW